MRTHTTPRRIDAQPWMLGLLALLAATAALPVGVAESRSQRFVRVRVDTANLRAEPSTSADRVRAAHQNEPLEVAGQQGQWLEVRDAAGDAAWIFAPLTDGQPAAVVIRDVVNVREQPGTGHPIAFTAERGVNLLVLERQEIGRAHV